MYECKVSVCTLKQMCIKNLFFILVPVLFAVPTYVREYIMVPPHGFIGCLLGASLGGIVV